MVTGLEVATGDGNDGNDGGDGSVDVGWGSWMGVVAVGGSYGGG